MKDNTDKEKPGILYVLFMAPIMIFLGILVIAGVTGVLRIGLFIAADLLDFHPRFF